MKVQKNERLKNNIAELGLIFVYSVANVLATKPTVVSVWCIRFYILAYDA